MGVGFVLFIWLCLFHSVPCVQTLASVQIWWRHIFCRTGTGEPESRNQSTGLDLGWKLFTFIIFTLFLYFTGSERKGQPIVISHIKEGGVAHRYECVKEHLICFMFHLFSFWSFLVSPMFSLCNFLPPSSPFSCFILCMVFIPVLAIVIWLYHNLPIPVPSLISAFQALFPCHSCVSSLIHQSHIPNHIPMFLTTFPCS